MDTPKFSILMANYNNGKFISESISSVIDQTSKDWELLILDDCSTDNSLDVIRPFVEKYENIRLIQHIENRGYIETLTKLINEAKSEIVGILDSDDALTSDAVTKILKAYNENPDCGFVYSQFMYCDESLNLQNIGFCREVPEDKSNLDIDCISHFKTFKKEYYFKTDGYDKNMLYAEDKDLAFKMEEVTKPIFVEDILYRYRVLSNSQGHDPKKATIRKISFLTAQYNAFMRRKAKGEFKESKMKMLERLFLLAYLNLKIKNFDSAFMFLYKIKSIF